MKKCSVEGCTNKYDSSGFCKLHGTRFRRHGDPTINKEQNIRTKDDLLKFAKYNGECIEWQKGVTNGYGRTVICGKIEYVHRAMYIFTHGKIPEGLQVNHKCNNRLCINPEHLYAGTHLDNMQDKCIAETGNTNKLTADDVKFIRNSDKDSRVLEKEFNLSKGYVTKIKEGKVWKHI